MCVCVRVCLCCVFECVVSVCGVMCMGSGKRLCVCVRMRVSVCVSEQADRAHPHNTTHTTQHHTTHHKKKMIGWLVGWLRLVGR